MDAMDPTKGDGKITPSDSRRIIRSYGIFPSNSRSLCKSSFNIYS